MLSGKYISRNTLQNIGERKEGQWRGASFGFTNGVTNAASTPPHPLSPGSVGLGGLQRGGLNT